jgi:tetratricopeptide (TPR) repeat protein
LRTLRPYAADLVALATHHTPLQEGFAFLCLVVFDALGLRAARVAVAEDVIAHTPTDTPFQQQVRALAYRDLHDKTGLAASHAALDDESTPEARLIKLFCVQRHVTGDDSSETFGRALLDQASAAKDHFVVARTCGMLGNILTDRNDLDEAEAVAQTLLSAARSAEDLDNQISAWSSLARVAFARGQSGEATRRLKEARLLGGPRHRYAGMLLGNLGLVQISAGDMAAAAETTRSGLELARRDGRIIQVILSLGALSEIHHENDEFEHFESYAKEAYELALTHLKDANRADRVWGYMAIVECSRGNYQAAKAHRQRWMDHFGTTRSELSQQLLAPIEAWVAAGLGDHDEARARLASTETLPHIWMAEQLWLKSECALAMADLELARENIVALQAMIEETGHGLHVLQRIRRTRARLAELASDVNGASTAPRLAEVAPRKKGRAHTP